MVETETPARPVPQILHGNADLVEPVAPSARAGEVEVADVADAPASPPAPAAVETEVVPPPPIIAEPAPVETASAPISQAPSPATMATTTDSNHRAPGLFDEHVHAEHVPEHVQAEPEQPAKLDDEAVAAANQPDDKQEGADEPQDKAASHNA
jgi:hypothetical protein